MVTAVLGCRSHSPAEQRGRRVRASHATGQRGGAVVQSRDLPATPPVRRFHLGPQRLLRRNRPHIPGFRVPLHPTPQRPKRPHPRPLTPELTDPVPRHVQEERADLRYGLGRPGSIHDSAHQLVLRGYALIVSFADWTPSGPANAVPLRALRPSLQNAPASTSASGSATAPIRAGVVNLFMVRGRTPLRCDDLLPSAHSLDPRGVVSEDVAPGQLRLSHDHRGFDDC